MPETPLDHAHAAMAAAPDADGLRLRFYDQLADTELFLLVEDNEGSDANSISPRVFSLEEGRFVLAFDTEDRLTRFTEGPAAYAALPGRVVAQQLAGSRIGLGLNLAVAPSAFLFPPEALDWLASTLDRGPEETEAQVNRFSAPSGLPQAFLDGLANKLARMPGLAQKALLAAVDYSDGRRGHILAFVGARREAEAALAKAVAEALTFSSVDAGEIDVTFLEAEDKATARLGSHGLSFDLPVLIPAQPHMPGAPGMDPAKPPKLR